MKKRLYLDIKERLKTAVLDENGEELMKKNDLIQSNSYIEILGAR